jgi:hypothetical protein
MESQQGLVALVDVLGFSALMTRQVPGSAPDLELYVKAAERGCQGIDAVMFSDTIVLTHPVGDDPYDALGAILEACARLMGCLIVADIPIRGAISYGSYYRLPRAGSVFIAGTPIVEAHERETSQEWLGISLCPSVMRKYDDLLDRTRLPSSGKDPVRELRSMMRWSRHLQPWQEIPIKDGRGGVEHYDGFAVVPTLEGTGLNVAHRKRPFEILAFFRHGIQQMRQQAPDARSQAKYQRTDNFLAAVEKKWVRAEMLFEGLGSTDVNGDAPED